MGSPSSSARNREAAASATCSSVSIVPPRTWCSATDGRTPAEEVFVDVEKAIVFAEREGYRALEIDLYRPEGAAATGPAPLILYVHGGGWRVSHRSRAPRETREWEPGFFERLT